MQWLSGSLRVWLGLISLGHKCHLSILSYSPREVRLKLRSAQGLMLELAFGNKMYFLVLNGVGVSRCFYPKVLGIAC